MQVLGINCAMDYGLETYGYAEGFSIFYFTDNLNVTKKFNKDTIKHYGNIEVFWIPREFNTIADTLAKKASEANVKNYLLEKHIEVEPKNIIYFLNKYSLSQRITLMKKIHKEPSLHELISLCFIEKYNENAKNYENIQKKFYTSKEHINIKKVLKLALTIISKKELTNGSSKAFNSILNHYNIKTPLNTKKLYEMVENVKNK